MGASGSARVVAALVADLFDEDAVVEGVEVVAPFLLVHVVVVVVLVGVAALCGYGG